ncbi:hypothetical protein GOP47_0005010 [Adiantum capillus-veneris]|uniref:Uncharacterized protein n=1 Tax=Adiantum capillus-veneris TaxID=13818 RepID=A0A9D4V4C5_ADICA|nr:hypothetical protein GOP47_0005010 [Adiantum capillus-veneris]
MITPQHARKTRVWEETRDDMVEFVVLVLRKNQHLKFCNRRFKMLYKALQGNYTQHMKRVVAAEIRIVVAAARLDYELSLAYRAWHPMWINSMERASTPGNLK